LTLQVLGIGRAGRRRGIGLQVRGQLIQQGRHATHVLHWPNWSRKSAKSKDFPLAIFLASFSALS